MEDFLSIINSSAEYRIYPYCAKNIHTHILTNNNDPNYILLLG